MFKYFLVLLLVSWHETRFGCAHHGDTSRNITWNSRKTPNVHNCSANTEESSGKSTVTLNGHINYHVGQQVFYLPDGLLLKQLLNLTNNSNNSKDAERPRVDYHVTPGVGAHKLHTRKLTWNSARKVCIEEGGHLAVINSLAEEKILLRMQTESDTSYAWLGLHDLYEEGDWVAVTGESLWNTGYTSWTTKWPNQPDNNGGNQNCACLVRDGGGMDDTVCSLLLPFFCEISV